VGSSIELETLCPSPALYHETNLRCIIAKIILSFILETTLEKGLQYNCFQLVNSAHCSTGMRTWLTSF